MNTTGQKVRALLLPTIGAIRVSDVESYVAKNNNDNDGNARLDRTFSDPDQAVFQG